MNKCYKIILKKICVLFILILIPITSNSQEVFQQKNIDSVFNKFTKPYQEVLYGHLNKSKFITGESIGFTIYAIDKKSKLLSTITSNIYCVISDSNNKVVKEQLIKAENGIANGDFLIDDTLENGLYTFKAYTNWMLNFSPQNIFVESFEIINANNSDNNKKVNRSSKIDVQLLPESGHLLADVLNTMGVVVKDSLGFGIANITGEVFDSKNKKITSFELNDLGIGRFSFTPQKGENYVAIIDNYGKKSTIYFAENIDETGVVLKISESNNEVLISAVTNKKSLSFLKDKKYKIGFHNGETLKSFSILFDKDLSITKKINTKNLSKGITIFTLFNENNNPIAERMFFNYHGLNFLEGNLVSKQIEKDSITIDLKFDVSGKIGFNNVSISVLPKETKSYMKNENIISQTYLKPYLKGAIENANYYFSTISKKTKYDLDNLLITQGWSSYDWTKIFQYENNYTYQFEDGITIKVNIPKTEEKSKFLIHNLSTRSPEMISFDEEIQSFTAYKYFPTDEENLFISKIGRKGNLEKIPLYIQYNPTAIPKTTNNLNYFGQKVSYYSFEDFVEADKFLKLNKREVLDEVVIKANLEQNRRKTIMRKSTAFGRIFFIENMYRNQTLANFLNAVPGLNSFDDFKTNTMYVYNIIAQGSPGLVLDGFPVSNDQLFFFFLDVVDFIQFDPMGYEPGFGARNAGVVKIITDPKKYQSQRETVSKFDFPITFTKPKKFYVPKYENYDDEFFKNYGVIDWLPINKIDENGNLKIIFNNEQPNDLVLYIEGVTEDGTFIVEEKTIKTE